MTKLDKVETAVKASKLKKLVPNAVSRKFARQILIANKNSPTILFVGGVAGVVTTTVLACRATLKLEDVLSDTQGNLATAARLRDEHSDKYSEEDYKKDAAFLYIRTAVKVGKLYSPAIIVGSLSIAALAGSHNILTKRNAAMTAAYAAVEKSFKEYRERVTTEFGEDKDRELRYGTEKVTVTTEDKNGPKKTVVTRVAPGIPSQYARFFDEFSTSFQREPEYNFLFLRCQQNYANDMLHSRGHVFLNEVYDMLGIERSKAGAVVGWVLNPDGDNFIDFGVFDGDNPKARDFVNGREGAILLDFNVDGLIYDKI
jgi:hypothetical protein